MNVYILGAGASRSYDISKSKQKLPLSRDFFKTFCNLAISKNGWVLIGDIVNYVRDNRHINPVDFDSFNEDIEALHSEVQQKYLEAINKKDFNNIRKYERSFTQLISLFCSVINEIQNGDESNFHKKLVNSLSDDDTIITFNWDTLVDRALRNNKKWSTQNGYFIEPKLVYNNGWENGILGNSNILLLKLHGSTNWLSSYIYYDDQEENFSFLHGGSQSIFYVYEQSSKPYPCYDGRYMDGYQEFSMGYYPPNLPITEEGKKIADGHFITRTILRTGNNPKGSSSDEGLISMPIIIPPVKNKSYDFYGNLFLKLWEKAEEKLILANKIYILGYSFPPTDTSSLNLFKTAFLKRNNIPEIIIINPFPDNLYLLFKNDFGIPDNRLKIIKDYITSDFNVCI